MTTPRPGLGDYFQDERRLGAGIGASAAHQIATRLSGVNYSTYVEPFLGRGDITRAISPHGTVVLNDLDCARVKQAERALCTRGGAASSSCPLVAHATCGKDWSSFLSRDAPSTLFVLDPPWENVRTSRRRDAMNYDENRPISAAVVAGATRSLKGTVAVVYKDDPAARAALCHPPFRCHRIHRNFFGRPFTQLLAVKPARGAA